MSVTTKLKVILMADDVKVAESDDAILWQNILGTITRASSSGISGGASLSNSTSIPTMTDGAPNATVAKFAQLLGVSQEEAIAACAPTTEAPYLQLDGHYWERFRKGLPPRGPGSISPMQLVGTILALWFKSAGLGVPKQVQAAKIMAELGLEDKNATRALENCPWLQNRSGIVINPTAYSRAIEVARAYCLKTSPTSEAADQHA